jgi:serine/threonine-protein kinase
LNLEPGRLFAHDFCIERTLAEGGMGAVYVVRQVSTGRLRALKLMQPALVQNDDFRRRFLLEAKVGASIASEHVVEVHLAGIDERTGAPFLVMELLDGHDLATHLERRGALAVAETREIFRQMCHALHLAHRAGIVHRDLKPPNVFLANPKRAEPDSTDRAARSSASFHVKVLDFGIAKMTHDATVGGAKTGMIGTPLWMAPEQAEHVPVTPAADVWALGLMLYTCATGRSFWRTGESESASLQQIMREILFDPIPRAGARASQQGVALPPELEAVVSLSVVRRPEERLPDAGAFFAALEDALAGKLSSSAAPAVAMTRSPFGETELVDTSPAGAPSLELAAEPRRGAPAVSAYAETFASPAVEPPRAPPPKTSPPIRAEDARSPWRPAFAVLGLAGAVAAIIALIGYSRGRPSAPTVLCRLCTVENGTFTNGVIPLRELRHDLEERFPELDARCVRNATMAGRAKLHWIIESGDVARGSATVTGGGGVGVCLLESVMRAQYAVILATTEVTYTLEWDPSHAAAWSTP